MAIKTVEDRYELARCIRELLSRTFIVRELENDEKQYRFSINHKDEIREVLYACGYDINVDDEAGVIMLEQHEDFWDVPGLKKKSMHTFKKDQIMIYLVLLQIYYRVMFDTETVATTIGDINDAIELNNMQISPKTREDALREFKKYKLISYQTEKERVADTIVTIYPSIRFAINMEEIKAIIERLNEELVDAETKNVSDADEEADA